MADEDMSEVIEIKEELDLETQAQDSVFDEPSTSSLISPNALKLEPQISEPLDNQACQICGEALAFNIVNVGPKGLKTLQLYSEIRQDHKFPPGLYPIQLHASCRVKYINGICKKDLEVMRQRQRLSLNDSVDDERDSSFDIDEKVEYQEQMPPDVLTDMPHNDSVRIKSESVASESFESESLGSETAILQQSGPLDRPGYCRICACALERDVAHVKRAGRAALQRASARRRDGKFPASLPETAVRVHGKCRLLYINSKSVAAEVKRIQRMLNGDGPTVTFPRIKMFDYCEQCVVCGEPAGLQFVRQQQKLPVTKRRLVSKILRNDTGERLYRASLDHSGSHIEELQQRLKGKDLVALGARYHRACYSEVSLPRKFPRGPSRTRGRPLCARVAAQADTLLRHVENHRDDSQFSVVELKSAGVTLNIHTMVRKLSERYENVLVNNRNIIITDGEIDLDGWHERKLKDKKSERLRIVRTAANIVLEDIRSIAFDNDRYPPATSFLDEVGSIPETLKTFVETVVTKYKRKPERCEATVTALSHSLMAAARPRTFESPLLLGIGSVIHQKYASKSLIDLLSSIGFCASYEDVTKFEMSVACHDKPKLKPEFTQFVFDSVDTQTDGYTGQSLVGVQCDTPRTMDSPIARVDRVPPNIVSGSYDEAPLQKYTQTTSGLKNVMIEDHRDDTAIHPTRGDALWLFGKSDPDLDLPSWDAFVAKMPKEKEYPVSEIRAMPAIFAPISNDSIYTALKQAQKKTERDRTCLVTFDQPLYQKAQDIVKSDSSFSNIVLRLGGFHLMTSFLGAIGYIMSGSGLKELWCSIYPAEQIEKMMTGHAYARAIKAHFLTRSALFNIITKDFDLTPEEKLEIESILDGGMFCMPQTDNQAIEKYQEPLAITLELLEKHGPTAKLWVQYFRMTTLVAQFLEAERTANWELHLSTIKKMLPYLHASGNFEYAKSCTLYLQDMQSLESKMSAEEYEKLTKKGYFTVRRTHKRWVDVWSDRTVQQTMTNVMKRTEEHNGRRITDSLLACFISAGPSLSSISDLIEDYCRLDQNETTEPSDEGIEEIKKFRRWFEEHNPFLETESMVSIGTGVSGKGVNCHEAEEIGKQMMAEKVGQYFHDVSYERDKCVRPLISDKSAIQIENFKIPIEPDTILRRIPITKKSEQKVKPYFKYELTPYPLSLFDEYGMLEANKSALFELFVPVQIGEGNRSHVIDGEYLLRRVPWKDGADVLSILNSYSEYVKTNFPNAIVVFGRRGNKGVTMMKSNKINTKHPTVEFQKGTVIKTSQGNFLSNDKNKDKFIQYLLIDLTRSGINVKLSSDDVNSYIVKTAVENASTYEETCLVSDNVDLLIMLCGRANKKNLYFMKPGRGKTPATYYHVGSLRSTKIKLNILFIHVVSGCDTTSAIFQQDKTKVAAAIESMSSKEIKDLVTVFRNPDADGNAVAKVGEYFFQKLYGIEHNLSDERYNSFKKSLSRSRYDLACLPPSYEACVQHMYRTYHQVQKWLGNDLPPTEWGWKLVGDRLEPITTSDVDLKELLDLISCKCNGICTGKCICKRAGLDCCVLCLNCNGKACHGIDMDADTYGMGYVTLSGCDAYGNLYDPVEVPSGDASNDDEEEAPRPSSPKRLRRDTALDENRRVTMNDKQRHDTIEEHRSDTVNIEHRRDTVSDEHRRDTVNVEHKHDTVNVEHNRDTVNDKYRRDTVKDEHRRDTVKDEHRRDTMNDEHRREVEQVYIVEQDD